MATLMGGSGAAIYIKPQPKKEEVTAPQEDILDAYNDDRLASKHDLENAVETTEEVVTVEDTVVEETAEETVVEEPVVEETTEVVEEVDSSEPVEETTEPPKRAPRRKSTRSRRKTNG